MTSFAILVSGRGSNMEALAEAVRDGRLDARIDFVVADSAEAPALEKARKKGIDTFVLPYAAEGKKKAEKFLSGLCSTRSVEWIVLAGFMRILSPEFVRAHTGRIVNIHPSLLPSFPGKDGIGDAWKRGVAVTGVTIHLVDEEVDSGTILAQRPVEIHPEDTFEIVEKKIHDAEHALYWKTLSELFRGALPVERRW